ncbi:hypothetical protein CBR_g49085 [Chara braunii]|uniref:Peptidase A2 domain-containing protein n=1 Tax=Chara braunii TaxID=69332 RepID=A0A388K4S5_CHABU|nr:hypothetical protein CBR_g49085 [Chara braunii]|eukprot:GBG65016.1 hypothetical protein CBR_g49085 [Chara braunii]
MISTSFSLILRGSSYGITDNRVDTGTTRLPWSSHRGVGPSVWNDLQASYCAREDGASCQTRGQRKASANQEPLRREPKQERRKKAVEVEEDDNEDEQDERLHQKEDRRVEQRAKKRGAQKEAKPILRDAAPKKKKYMVRLEEGFDVEKVIDKLLEGHNDLVTLKEILASAPKLRNELKGRFSLRFVPNVHLSVILPKEAEWAETRTKMDCKCVACGMVDLVVKRSQCAAMGDTGAEMNIIKEVDALRFGLEIDRSDCGILHGANCKVVFCGTTSNIEIGKVKARACSFVMPDVDHAILPGRSFLWENEDIVSESQDNEFEEGEIKKAFRAEEYDGIYLELGLLLSGETRDMDASKRAQKIRHLYLVRDNHRFVKRSDFTKPAMSRGGRGTRPPRRPLGA